MIIYSVTVSVDRDAAEEWLGWMTSVHIPDVMRAGYFRSYAMRRVVVPEDETGRPTYTIEYTCASRERYDAYQREAAPALQRDHTEKFGGRVEASRWVYESLSATGEMFLSGGAFDPHDPEVVSSIDDLALWSAPFGLALLETVELRRDVRMLDVGCGLGFPLIELSQRLGPTCRAWGIDPWREAVDRARMKIRTWGITNVEVVEGRAEAMPFDDGFFDLVVSNNGTNNVGDEATEVRVYNEIARVAKPGAQVVFTVNTPETMREFYDAFREVLRGRGLGEAAERVDAHIREKRKPLEHIRRTVEGAGLVVADVRTGEFTMRFADATAMLEHFVVKLAFRDHWEGAVDDAHRAAVFGEVRERLDGAAERSGGLTLTIPWLCMDCRKPA